MRKYDWKQVSTLDDLDRVNLRFSEKAEAKIRKKKKKGFKNAKTDDEMFSFMGDFQKYRESDNIELMNNWMIENALKRYKKDKKKIKKSKRCLGMGEERKETARCKASGKIEVSTRRWNTYKRSGSSPSWVTTRDPREWDGLLNE